MSQEYTPERLEMDAALIADCGLPYGSYKDEVAAVYRAYAATLKAAQGGVTEAEDGASVLQRLGDDAAKWASEFRATALRLGYSDMDEGWLIGWFANAIEHSGDVRRWRKEAALSAQQGQGWPDESRKYLAYRLTQMAEGGPLAFCADTLRDAASWLTAPPAQPAERVPERFLAIGTRVMWEDSIGRKWPATITGYNPATYNAELDDGTDALGYARGRFTVDAASPAHSPARGDGKEVSRG